MHRHVDVYLDESGDLGFSGGSSEHFIVVALVVPRGMRIARITNKCHRRFKSSLTGNPEIKFNRCGVPARRFVLSAISATDSLIVWSGVRKSTIGPSLRADKDAIWRQVACQTVSDVSRRLCVRSMDIVVDRRSVKKVVRSALEAALEETAVRCHAGAFPPEVCVSHLDSASSPGLRVVDHVAGAVFQCLERGDRTYIDIIGERILCGVLRHL